MRINTTVQLHNGVEMPLLGLGTTHNGGYNHETVVYAVRDCKYRLIDTAKRYGVELYLGEAIRESGVPREDIFLTTKLWPNDYGTGKTAEAFEGSVERLGTDYLDLYMLHWPDVPQSVSRNRKQCLEETWRELELLYENEKCRAIGVSNFYEEELDDLLETASVVPHVNQCEFHPYQNPLQLRQYCKELRIQFQGYCPLGKGMLLKDPTVIHWSKKLRVTPAQILLRWSTQNKVVTIPKSTKKHRVLENSKIFTEVFLPKEAMKELNQCWIGNSHRRVVNLESIKKRLSSGNDHNPDGYKLANAPNIFPKKFRFC